MNPSLATTVLVLTEGTLLLLPLLPALSELRGKKDAEPLTVILDYSGDVHHFARGFRKYIEELQAPLERCVSLGTAASGRLANGEEYLLLGQGGEGALLELGRIRGSACRLVIASGRELRLPEGVMFWKEIYAAGDVIGGRGNTYRAILGEKDIHLGPESQVIRWAHACGGFRADPGSRLFGRISSDQIIALAPECTFQRLHAPRIVMGQVASQGAAGDPCGSLASPPRFSVSAQRRLVDEDVEVRPGEQVEEDIVTRGKLRIGAGAKVLGSVKSHRSLVVEAGAEVAGSLISADALWIGRECRIRGPVLAERHMEIGCRTRCGSPDSLTTVSSLRVDAEEGAVFCGTLWAREVGRVVARR